MKKLVLLFLLIPFFAIGQVTDTDLIPYEIPNFEFQSGEILLREIANFEADQKKLHSIAQKSISEMYRNSKAVTDLNDIENGLLIIKGTLPLSINGFYAVFGSYKPLNITYDLNHVLTIESRENRIRISIDKFSFSSAISSDGQTMVFNPENKLDENYINVYKQSLSINRLKKADIANTYNKSLILNELNLIGITLIEKIQEIYIKELNDDW
jgi:hypothetical protein